jgi:hypothetical protein
MSCNRASGGKSRRHDAYKAALSRITHVAACHCEPPYHGVGLVAPGGQGARADVDAYLPQPQGYTLLDVAITSPRCASLVVAAALCPGAAAQ